MNGKNMEDLIIVKIQQKCDIKREAAYDHIYKLDFIIDHFKHIHKMIPVGVQVTTRLNDIPKRREFVTVRQKKTMVDKSIYVEVHPEVDVNAWGSELIYNAIVAFCFEKQNKEKEICGVRINPDISYEFFEMGNEVAPSEKTSLTGSLNHYRRDKGFGFIVAEGQSYFYHISEVGDPQLGSDLSSDAEIDTKGNLDNPIEVIFDDAGYDSEKSKYRKAVNVRRMK